MPRTCTICDRRDCSDVDRALIAGGSAREVAARFDLGWQAVNRHRLNHLPAAIRRAAREALTREDAAGNAISVSDEQSRIEVPEARQRPFQPAGEAIAATNEPALASAPPPIGRTRRRGIQLDETPPVLEAGATVSLPAASVDPGSRRTVPAVPPAGTLNLHAAATDLRNRAMAILTNAERDGDTKNALAAIREARGVLDHLVRLEERQGGSAQAVPLVSSPDWIRTRTAIVTALADYPEARLAVAEALTAAGALQ